jgi:hypothetical protein
LAPLLIGFPGSFASDTDRLGFAIFLVVLFVGSLGLPGYYRSIRTLRLDDNGVVLLHGSRTKRSLQWGEITGIEHGPRTLSFGVVLGNYRGYELLVRSQKKRYYISVFDGYYRSPEGAFAKFINSLESVAKEHSVPVSQKSSGWGFI